MIEKIMKIIKKKTKNQYKLIRVLLHLKAALEKLNKLLKTSNQKFDKKKKK